MAYINRYIGDGGASGGVGQAAVDRMRQAGYSNDQISSMINQSGYTVGAAAQASLGGGSTSSSAPRTTGPSHNGTVAGWDPNAAAAWDQNMLANVSKDARQFVGDGSSGSGFGMAAVSRARSAGLSDPQIKQMALNSGLTIGPAAMQSLQLSQTTGNDWSGDYASGTQHQFRELWTPSHGVVRVAGGGDDESIRAFLAGGGGPGPASDPNRSVSSSPQPNFNPGLTNPGAALDARSASSGSAASSASIPARDGNWLNRTLDGIRGTEGKGTDVRASLFENRRPWQPSGDLDDGFPAEKSSGQTVGSDPLMGLVTQGSNDASAEKDDREFAASDEFRNELMSLWDGDDDDDRLA